VLAKRADDEGPAVRFSWPVAVAATKQKNRNSNGKT
jgi:hypothetical protein